MTPETTERLVRVLLETYSAAHYVAAPKNHTARERVIQEATKSASRIIAEQPSEQKLNAPQGE